MQMAPWSIYHFLLQSEGWVIPEVASFKEEGLVIPKDEKEKKERWKIVAPWGNWTRISCMKGKSTDHYTIETLLGEGVD